MFYNSKKLIDEKVLQQYFFECFMLADSAERRRLLPEQFSDYAASSTLKGLDPEVDVGRDENGKRHITDFVLYPMPSAGLQTLNIEIKWRAEDFQRQQHRFSFYDGRKGRGFVVALSTGNDEPEFLGAPGLEIGVVYLNPDHFKKWFSLNANTIVSQALATKLGTKPERPTGPRFWVVTVVSASREHYFSHGLPNGIWAFRDTNRPKRIMQILEGDYIAFVHLSHCKPSSMVYPHSSLSSRAYERSRGGSVLTSQIDWTIGHVDIFKIDLGYHLNYKADPLYAGFEEAWFSEEEQRPERKDYTQFIRMSREGDDLYEYRWDLPLGEGLNRKLFPESEQGLASFVDAVRLSMNTRGDAREISRLAFEAVLRLLGR